MVMGSKNKRLGTENKNFSSNQSGAIQEEKGQSILHTCIDVIVLQL